MECVAVLDACGAIGVGQEELRSEATSLFVRIVEMLSRMARVRRSIASTTLHVHVHDDVDDHAYDHDDDDDDDDDYVGM